MYCRNCGRQIPESARFCGICGAKIEVQHPISRRGEQNKTSDARITVPANTSPRRSTKKVFLTIFFGIFVAISWICGSLDMSIPGLIRAIQQGEPLRYRAMYRLEETLEEGYTSVTIRQSDWDVEVCSWNSVEYFLRDYLQATPELYHVDMRNTKIAYFESSDGDSGYKITIAYFDEINNSAAQNAMESVVAAFLKDIPADATDWEKALLIHDALIRHVTYEAGVYDQTAYGALVEGKAVCMGYAMAYEYLLSRVGVQCDTVVGYADEFSAAMDGTLFQMDRHAWSIVTFSDTDGTEKSYYVDTTWDDLDIQDANGVDYISRRWFCATQEDIDKEGRSTLDEGYNMSRWNLDDDSMNYYVYTDSIIYTYDLDRVVEILRRQIEQGSNFPSVRLADMQTFYDLTNEIEYGDASQKLCEELGFESFNYSFSSSVLGDGLICFNLWLNYPEEQTS